MLGSFKVKLVGTFLALSVVPVADAFWGFSAVAERSDTIESANAPASAHAGPRSKARSGRREDEWRVRR